jgi:type IV pilus assembly protein PilW
MVGMVVALLVGLAASGAAISFGAAQKQGIGAGGGAVNVNTAMAAIKNDLAAGGLGFFGDEAYMCNQLSLSVTTGVLLDGANFVPVRVTRNGTNDQVDVLYGNRVEGGANVRLRGASNGTFAEVDSFLPVTVNDAVVLAPETAGAACTVRTVTAVTAAVPPAPQRLTFAASGLHNNQAFATSTAYATNARVGVVGALNWSRYRLVGTDLVMERPMTGQSAVIARNVMAFRAQYGVSSAATGSTTLESWENATAAPWQTLGANEVRRVRALRLGIITRSTAREKPSATGQCESTLSMPTLLGAPVTADVTDWACHRFNSIVVVVPMRNAVMGVR